MPRYEVPLNGAGPYYLVLYTSQSGRTVSATLMWRRDPYGFSSFSGAARWSLVIGGVYFEGGHNFNAPAGGAIGETLIGGASQYIYSGTTVQVTGGFNSDVSPGSASIVGYEVLATPPPPPSMRQPSQITPTSMLAQFDSNGDGGAPVTSWALQYSTSPTFAWGVLIGSSGTSFIGNLTPDTTYYFRARGQNMMGVSGWSNVTSATTTTLSAPSMSVEPNLSGTNATVTLSPPGGVSSVSSYRVERRLVGGSTVVHDTTTSPFVVDDLTPGASYEWRASAFVDTYQTPWTDWTLVTQPQPNTNPGDYFDGSTPDKIDVDYQWNGTVNNSTSRAVAKAPAGWRSFAEGNADSGGLGVVIRATGGRSGTFGARVTFFTDTDAPGFHGGTALSDPGVIEVAEGGVYWGSIYVSPSRDQRMAAEMIWLDASYAPIGTSVVGDAQIFLVDPGDPPVRLTVQGTAPAGTTYGAVGWVDVAGSGWSPWQGGDTVMMDDAMVSIGVLYGWFSGDTLDTNTQSYSWLGAPNASVSEATAIDPLDFDPLADPDCPPIPSAPRPPQIDDSCIDEVSSWRRYWAIIPETEVYDWLAVVPTMTVTTGSVAAHQVRIRFFANPDALDPEEAGALEPESEQVISYIPPFTEMTLDGVSRRAWASVDGGEELPASHLLYGAGGGPATWPTLECGSAYLISFDVPLDAPSENVTVGVSLTTRMM